MHKSLNWISIAGKRQATKFSFALYSAFGDFSLHYFEAKFGESKFYINISIQYLICLFVCLEALMKHHKMIHKCNGFL